LRSQTDRAIDTKSFFIFLFIGVAFLAYTNYAVQRSKKRKFLMQLTYNYRLTPAKAQLTTIAAHLELCRRQYNYRLGERFRWWESTRTPINACPLTVSIVPVEEIYQNIPLTRTQTRDGRKKDDSGNPLTRKGDVFSNVEGGYVQWQTIQLADLKNTKKLFPDIVSGCIGMIN